MPPRQPTSTSSEPRATAGRDAQRRRTRAAILDAATQLIRSGMTPSVDQIAAASDVSRRTVYMHFATLDQLLLDATVGALSNTVVDKALRSDSTDPVARVDALVQAVTQTADETLPLGRKIIALTVDDHAGPGPRRGHRRVGWINAALAPVRDQLTDEQYERLVGGLSIIVGWEAMIILRDVGGHDAEQEARIMRWAATALVRSVLAE